MAIPASIFGHLRLVPVPERLRAMLRRPLLEQEKVTALMVVFMLLLNPLSALAGLASWSVLGLLLLDVKSINIRSMGHVVLINVFLTGAFAWSAGADHGHLLGPVAVAVTLCILLVYLCQRLWWLSGLPVLVTPTLVTLKLLTYFKLLLPAPAYQVQGSVGGYLILVGLALWAVYSPLSALIVGLGAGISLVVNAGGDTATIAVPAMVFFVVVVAANRTSLAALTWAGIGAAVASVWMTHLNIQSGPNIDLVAGLLVVNVCAASCLYGCLLSSKPAFYQPWYLRPEDKLDTVAHGWSRFRSGEARIYCPFTGRWAVYQGFNGAWTHQGVWRHSLDFVIRDDRGQSFRTFGHTPEDYYAFGQPIIAPTTGYVVGLCDHFPDNVIGAVDNQNAWGNYVIIRDAFGAHVVIAHLQHQSISCKLYQFIEAGQELGRCGNSGYSPEPHIHVHVQVGPYLGSETIAFHLMNYINDRGDAAVFESHAVPQLGDTVINPPMNESLAKTMSFVLGDRFAITDRRRLGEAPLAEVTNQLDPVTGTMFFASGTAKLYHSRYGSNFCFTYYSGPRAHPLFDLMVALPRLPLLFDVVCHFADQAPQQRRGWSRYKGYLAQWLPASLQRPNGLYRFDARRLEVKGSVEGSHGTLVTHCKIDPLDGICEFSVSDRHYSVACVDHVGSGAQKAQTLTPRLTVVA